MAQVEKYAPSYLISVKGKKLQQKLQHGVSVDVLSVSVTETIDRADSFTFTLRERNPDPQRLFAGGPKLQWMDSDLLEEGSKVEIHMGYVGDLQLMVRGTVKAATVSFPESGQPTIRVEGYSLYHDLQHKHLRNPFKANTDSGVAEEIAELTGLDATVDKTDAEYPLLSPKDASLGEYLQARARRIGYELTIKDRTLYFQKPRYLVDRSPALTLQWGRHLRSFSPRVSVHNMVTKVTVRSSQTTHGGRKAALVGEARAGAERVKMGKETGSQAAKRVHKENEVLITDRDIMSQQEAREMALARLEARSLDFISGQGSVIGDPNIRARQVVEIKDIGKRFSGSHYITSTTHTIDSSGYRTDFEVKRNAQWA
jgi:phage protein D